MPLFDSINHGLIIMVIVGFMLLVMAVFTALAPNVKQQDKPLALLRLPLIGWILSFFGIGEVSLLFLLGIYPFIIGSIGWGGNLLWYWYFGSYPTSKVEWWLIRLVGFVIARIFICIAGKLKIILRTYTVAKAMIPERFIGTTGNVIAILGNGILEVNIYDELVKCQVQLYCLPWENASETHFIVGDKVYVVDLIAPRRYSVVKFDSEDQLRVLGFNY